MRIILISMGTMGALSAGFTDRRREIAFLDGLLDRRHPGPGQLLLVYGRRRVGKSRLLLHWGARSRRRFVYWAAEKEAAVQQRRKLYARLIDVEIGQAPLFGSWAELWAAAARRLRDEPHVLVLDEAQWALESDAATLSALQHAPLCKRR